MSFEGIVLLSISPLNAVPVVPVDRLDHAPTTAFDTEVRTLSPISLPVTVSERLGSASGRGLETPPTVSDHWHALPTIVVCVANYCSFSTCLWLPIAHYRPRCPMP